MEKICCGCGAVVLVIDVKGEKEETGPAMLHSSEVRSVLRRRDSSKEDIDKAQQARTAKVKMEGAVPR